MNRLRRTVLMMLALAMAGMCVPALGEISFEGSVVASEKVAVQAPFGGLIDKVYLRPGDLVEIGDAVATIGTTRVYASVDGTVCGVFGQPGDSAEGITTRYGGVVYIEPTNRFVASASTEKAYNSSETKYIRVGEKVYLSCTQDGSHTGTAVVTSVKEADESGNTPYALEITGGEFYMGETVGIFRSKDFASSTRIGRGVIAQNAAVAVTGTGSILRMHVTDGEKVERGQLLFETVEGTLDGLYAVDNNIVSDVAGVVATVDAAVGAAAAKGGNLVTVYPQDAFQIQVSVSELDLPDIAEGDKVYIEFEWDNEEIRRYEGTVRSISHLSATGADGAPAANVEYAAYIDFVPDDSVRLGMSVIVYVDNGEAPDEDSAADSQ